MNMIRMALIGSTAFLGLTASAGGIALLTGTIAPAFDLLDGSPFDDYRIPGVSLAGLGVLSLIAAVMLAWQRSAAASLLATASGVGIVIYEVVQVRVIGPHFLQAFYALLGVAIVVLAFVLQRIRRTERSTLIQYPVTSTGPSGMSNDDVEYHL